MKAILCGCGIAVALLGPLYAQEPGQAPQADSQANTIPSPDATTETGVRSQSPLAGCLMFATDRKRDTIGQHYDAAAECARRLQKHLDDDILSGWKKAEPPPEIGGARLDSDTGKRQYLVGIHTFYRQLKFETKDMPEPKPLSGRRPDEQSGQEPAEVGDQPGSTAAAAQRRAVEHLETLARMDRIGRDIHDLMATAGIRERLAAAFDGGVSFAEAGNDTVRSARDRSLETTGSGVIRWETEHFGDDGRGRVCKGGRCLIDDFSIGGAFGFVPVATMVSVNEGSGVLMTDADASVIQPFATHFPGMMWEVAPRLNRHFGRRNEMSLLGRLGHTWLTGETSTFERKAGKETTSIVLQRLRNGPGRVAHFREVAVEWRLHTGETLDRTHHEATYLTPAAWFALGYRHDARFAAGDQLIGTEAGRLFVRLGLSVNRITGLPKESKISSIRFGVDFEHGRGAAPSSIRWFIGPDINVVKLLRADAP